MTTLDHGTTVKEGVDRPPAEQVGNCTKWPGGKVQPNFGSWRVMTRHRSLTCKATLRNVCPFGKRFWVRLLIYCHVLKMVIVYL